MKKRFLKRLFCVLVSILFFVSCGGGGDGTSSTPTDTTTGTTISGVASKGLIFGGTIEIYEITRNGEKGELLGSTDTDNEGRYSLLIDFEGPVLVEVSGGTYTDEATGQTLTLAEPLRAALPFVTTDIEVAVTPVTELAVRIASSTGNMDATKIQEANDLLSQLVGEDIVSTLPADCDDSSAFGSADADAQNYALFLAALSQMSETSGQKLSEVLEAIEEDLEDMQMDQTSGDLLTALNDFLASENNQTGVNEATELVDVIEDIVENGMDPTYRMGSGYLQYRTFESGTAYRGYFSATKSGLPIQIDDVASLTIKNSQNQDVNFSNVGFWNGRYYYYDCRTEPCTEKGPYKESGFYGSLDTLSSDTYRIDLLTTNGQTATTTIPYTVPLALPLVTSASMQSQWSNGDLILSWTNPTGGSNWSEVDQIRVVLFDIENRELLYVSLGVNTQTVTLPSELVAKASKLGVGGVTTWQVQTRAYDTNGMNYARGNSDQKGLSYAIGYSYLQYRTFEDASRNQYRAWMEVRTDGGLAATDDFTNFRITDSSDSIVSPSNTPVLWIPQFPYLIYNCLTTPCTLGNTFEESGFSASYSDLPEGSYQLMADSYEGPLSTVIEFPGKLELPVIPSASMQAQEETNGDLTLSWTNPTTEANWSEVDQIRIVLSDQDGNDLLYVKVKPSDNTVTIPSDAKAIAESISGGTISQWTMQTRAYDQNNINIARGISWYNGN